MKPYEKPKTKYFQLLERDLNYYFFTSEALYESRVTESKFRISNNNELKPFLNYNQEEYIRTLAICFQVSVVWWESLHQYNSGRTITVKDLRIFGTGRRIHFFCKALSLILTSPNHYQKKAFKEYNKKLRRARKKERRYPGRYKKPPSFKEYFSKRKNQIDKDTQLVLNNLLDRYNSILNMPTIMDSVREFMEEQRLEYKPTTRYKKNQRRIW